MSQTCFSSGPTLWKKLLYKVMYTQLWIRVVVVVWHVYPLVSNYVPFVSCERAVVMLYVGGEHCSGGESAAMCLPPVDVRSHRLAIFNGPTQYSMDTRPSSRRVLTTLPLSTVLGRYEMGIGQRQMREVTTAKGKRQWEIQLGYENTFMMIPADVALWWDEAYRVEVKR